MSVFVVSLITKGQQPIPLRFIPFASRIPRAMSAAAPPPAEVRPGNFYGDNMYNASHSASSEIASRSASFNYVYRHPTAATTTTAAAAPTAASSQQQTQLLYASQGSSSSQHAYTYATHQLAPTQPPSDDSPLSPLTPSPSGYDHGPSYELAAESSSATAVPAGGSRRGSAAVIISPPQPLPSSKAVRQVSVPKSRPPAPSRRVVAEESPIPSFGNDAIPPSPVNEVPYPPQQAANAHAYAQKRREPFVSSSSASIGAAPAAAAVLSSQNPHANASHHSLHFSAPIRSPAVPPTPHVGATNHYDGGHAPPSILSSLYAPPLALAARGSPTPMAPPLPNTHAHTHAQQSPSLPPRRSYTAVDEGDPSSGGQVLMMKRSISNLHATRRATTAGGGGAGRSYQSVEDDRRYVDADNDDEDDSDGRADAIDDDDTAAAAAKWRYPHSAANAFPSNREGAAAATIPRGYTRVPLSEVERSVAGGTVGVGVFEEKARAPAAADSYESVVGEIVLADASFAGDSDADIVSQQDITKTKPSSSYASASLLDGFVCDDGLTAGHHTLAFLRSYGGAEVGPLSTFVWYRSASPSAAVATTIRSAAVGGRGDRSLLPSGSLLNLGAANGAQQQQQQLVHAQSLDPLNPSARLEAARTFTGLPSAVAATLPDLFSCEGRLSVDGGGDSGGNVDAKADDNVMATISRRLTVRLHAPPSTPSSAAPSARPPRGGEEEAVDPFAIACCELLFDRGAAYFHHASPLLSSSGGVGAPAPANATEVDSISAAAAAGGEGASRGRSASVEVADGLEDDEDGAISIVAAAAVGVGKPSFSSVVVGGGVGLAAEPTDDGFFKDPNAVAVGMRRNAAIMEGAARNINAAAAGAHASLCAGAAVGQSSSSAFHTTLTARGGGGGADGLVGEVPTSSINGLGAGSNRPAPPLPASATARGASVDLSGYEAALILTSRRADELSPDASAAASFSARLFGEAFGNSATNGNSTIKSKNSSFFGGGGDCSWWEAIVLAGPRDRILRAAAIFSRVIDVARAARWSRLEAAGHLAAEMRRALALQSRASAALRALGVAPEDVGIGEGYGSDSDADDGVDHASAIPLALRIQSGSTRRAGRDARASRANGGPSFAAGAYDGAFDEFDDDDRLSEVSSLASGFATVVVDSSHGAPTPLSPGKKGQQRVSRRRYGGGDGADASVSAVRERWGSGHGHKQPHYRVSKHEAIGGEEEDLSDEDPHFTMFD